MAILNYGGMVQQGLGNLGNQLMQAQGQRDARGEKESQQQALAGLGELYGNGATTQELYQYGLDNPGAFERVNQTIGFKSDQTKQIMQDTLISALQNPEQRDQIIAQGSEAIQAAGGNPQYLSQAIGEDTEGFERGAVPFLASLGGQGANFAKTYMGMKPQAAEGMNAYQQATIDTKRTDQDLRRLEIEQKRLDAQYKRETDDLKRSELEQKIETNKAEQQSKATEKEQAKVNAENFSSEVYDLATSIANDPQLNDITGPVNTMLPTVSGKSQDLINKAERLESMLTKENLGLMSGVLTDKDIQMLRSISSGINVTDGGIKGSYEGTKKRLMQIADKIQSATGRSGQSSGNSFTSSSGVKFTVE